ncbi:hypothetical protein [Pelagicoccus albus]|uniref:Uncharacterized protein n=1 Tax=Pelagicoccus albus TaxID=415222 RepID=A0A7X1E8A2_9BACT|nr:hypothetical protein [Pelagicoccus albus]MBC2606590.1 hypothetical protein [Pelagicoccus albus]
MDNLNSISFNEAELLMLFEEAGLTEQTESDTERIKKVIERSLHEKAIKDTASFVFQGFPAAIVGFVAVAANAVGDKKSDYRA